MRSKEVTMNITNQINAGLNDVRGALIDLSCSHSEIEKTLHTAKAAYQLDLIVAMIKGWKQGEPIPWSDLKLQVSEEFEA